ncbi:heparinase II/III family protein [Microbacterium sp. XT11]|uniref:heparinase II/III family protein n=1 Tax=Microbacterium sp. XT11 TaxID=367477 RepID=UPI000742EAD3|nr:heparinase II/III family protein [Microbacterium sp. XT11]ALX65699.1 hypothetical protein AB663_000363 [Microbacterium sp. XT11]
MNEQAEPRASTLMRRGALRSIWAAAGAPASVSTPLTPPSSDRAAWDAVDRDLRALILATADAVAGERWPQPLLSQWASYARTGDRSTYESEVFARNLRIRFAVLAAALDPAPHRLAEAADGLWLLCEQTTWCWPAHDDAFSRGRLVPDRPVLDLGAGEEAALAAWSALVLGDALDEFSPGLTERLAREARTRVLEPFVQRRDWPWEGWTGPDGGDRVHNWAPWIHGNLVIAAIAFADDELRAAVLGLCVDGIDRYLAQLPADGAIDEGFAYWWQGAARAFDALSVLDGLTGGAVAAAVRGGPLVGLRELARFPERMVLGDGWVASFSDAEARPRDALTWHVLFRAARLCGLDETAAFAAGHRDMLCGREAGVAAGLGRMLAELFDPEWRRAAGRAAPAPARVELRSIGVGLRRERAGEATGLTVVVKGGHNGENHNHNDLGSFAVAVDGVPQLIDLGRAAYTAQTFSDARYELWYVQSGWHSTPSPFGREQRAGEQWRASVEPREDGWDVDLAHAYPWPMPGADGGAAEPGVPDAASPNGDLAVPWMRRVRLRGGLVTVRDESPALAHPDTLLVVVCAGVPDSGDDGIRIPGRHGARDLLLDHDPAEVRVETRDVDDPFLAHSWGARVSRVLFRPIGAPVAWEVRVSVA